MNSEQPDFETPDDPHVADDVWAPGELLRAHARPEMPDQATIDAAIAVALNTGVADASLDAQGVINLDAARRARSLRLLGVVAAVSMLIVGTGITVTQLNNQSSDQNALVSFSQLAEPDTSRDATASPSTLTESALAGDMAPASSSTPVVAVGSVSILRNALLGLAEGQVPQGWETALLSADPAVCAGVAYGVFTGTSLQRLGNISYVVDPNLIVDPPDPAMLVPQVLAEPDPQQLAQATTVEVWLQQGITSAANTPSFDASVLLLRVDSCQEVAVP